MYTNLKKVKRKNVNLTSRVKSTNQDYGNHGITATLQKHYHYYYESWAKIHNMDHVFEKIEKKDLHFK